MAYPKQKQWSENQFEEVCKMKDYPKLELGTRVIAALIDGALSFVVGFIPILGAVYMLLKDGLFEGQSVGKMIMKTQVVTENGEKADFAVSARRNAIFALPIAIMIIPILGWIIAPFLSLGIIILELIKVQKDPQGRRIGDSWAGTQVILFTTDAQVEITKTTEEGS
jgi:uncharacterized RDD family membrane protein YckC